jgi:hypothetical protein
MNTNLTEIDFTIPTTNDTSVVYTKFTAQVPLEVMAGFTGVSMLDGDTNSPQDFVEQITAELANPNTLQSDVLDFQQSLTNLLPDNLAVASYVATGLAQVNAVDKYLKNLHEDCVITNTAVGDTVTNTETPIVIGEHPVAEPTENVPTDLYGGDSVPTTMDTTIAEEPTVPDFSLDVPVDLSGGLDLTTL